MKDAIMCLVLITIASRESINARTAIITSATLLKSGILSYVSALLALRAAVAHLSERFGKMGIGTCSINPGLLQIIPKSAL